ncbi:MAG: adenylate kinase [Acidimicrobiaceae bacterium]|nr:adenylate kinase [Acidimicrobiaceae bacterium]MDQ1444410.1 adenylate kinase [Acidimicrobiaceae bacterium]
MVPGVRLVILGKQGAGKGTQCVRLARHYVVPHISTGDMFRAAVRMGTEFGMRAREYMDAGELIPDEVVIGVVKERLEQDDTKVRGFILDGFPRTSNQAEQLAAILGPNDVDLAIDIEVPMDVVLKRLAGRRVCSTCGTNFSTATPPKYDWTCDVCGGEVVQREDDTVDAIKRRLVLYEEQTEPLITWYLERDKLVSIDGMGTPDDVTQRLVRAIDRRRDALRGR